MRLTLHYYNAYSAHSERGNAIIVDIDARLLATI